jgi:hypothetical protein
MVSDVSVRTVFHRPWDWSPLSLSLTGLTRVNHAQYYFNSCNSPKLHTIGLKEL